MRQGMTPAVVGLLVGLGLGVIGGQVMASLLFAISPADAPTFAAVAVVLTCAAIAACLIPARAAAKVQPAATLKAP
jgi:putative ABC transport system permease protein